MNTLRRTHDRPVTLLFKAAEETRGPYFIVDRAGFGVAWTKPRGGSWTPSFDRARLAFTLVNEDPDITPQRAKFIADRTFNVLGHDVDMGDAEKYAWALVEGRNPPRSMRTSQHDRRSRNRR